VLGYSACHLHSQTTTPISIVAVATAADATAAGNYVTVTTGYQVTVTTGNQVTVT